jgi:hypothetical protein
MIDFYLKFPDEAQATSILYTTTLEVTDENGVVVQEGSVRPNFANIDVIGTIYAKTPDPMPEGYEPVALDGFHVNVRVVGEDTSSLTTYAMTPVNPRRVWA